MCLCLFLSECRFSAGKVIQRKKMGFCRYCTIVQEAICMYLMRLGHCSGCWDVLIQLWWVVNVTSMDQAFGVLHLRQKACICNSILQFASCGHPYPCNIVATSSKLEQGGQLWIDADEDSRGVIEFICRSVPLHLAADCLMKQAAK